MTWADRLAIGWVIGCVVTAAAIVVVPWFFGALYLAGAL